MGCKILMDGYEMFRGWVVEHTELDVDNFITIQSMASSLLKSGCYGNVYQTSGVIQQFITKCVVGGRVMTNSDEQYHVKPKLQNLMLVVYILLLCILCMGFWKDYLRY